MRYTTVLFDLDGTLLDTLDDITDAVNYTLFHFGKPIVERDAVRRLLGHGAEFLLAGASGECRGTEALEKIKDFYLPYYELHSDIKTAPYPGIIKLVSDLKDAGVNCAVVSNKPDGAVKALAKIKFDGVFKLAVGESETIKAKPDPSGVISAMHALGGDLSNTIYVGDSEVDVLTAKNAGIPVIGVSWGFRDEDVLRREGADYVVSDAQEIFDIVNG